MPWSLDAPVHSELIVKKSRFIGCVESVADRPAAVARVAALRAAHPAAAHVCWALMAGGQSAAVDDGEPGGTAGRPMLEVLRHHDLEGVMASVVRYFGGVKLGAGGLVRAYTETVASALMGASKRPLVRMVQQSCRVSYALEGTVRHEIELLDARLQHVAHGAVVEITWVLPSADATTFRDRIDLLTHGKAVWNEA